MDALTLCLVVFQISVFILQLDQINCQPLYENPQEDSLTDSGQLYCRKYYGKELFDCYYVLIYFYNKFCRHCIHGMRSFA